MVEAYNMKKEEQMLDYAMQRKNASDQAIADAQATVDAFVSGAVTSGINTAIKASDIRLKENITKTGVSKSGIPKYTFNYKGENTLWSGAMAQDLISMGRSDAVTIMDNGYYGVNYDMIDIDMIKN